MRSDPPTEPRTSPTFGGNTARRQPSNLPWCTLCRAPCLVTLNLVALFPRFRSLSTMAVPRHVCPPAPTRVALAKPTGGARSCQQRKLVKIQASSLPLGPYSRQATLTKRDARMPAPRPPLPLEERCLPRPDGTSFVSCKNLDQGGVFSTKHDGDKIRRNALAALGQSLFEPGPRDKKRSGCCIDSEDSKCR